MMPEPRSSGSINEEILTQGRALIAVKEQPNQMPGQDQPQGSDEGFLSAQPPGRLRVYSAHPGAAFGSSKAKS